MLFFRTANFIFCLACNTVHNIEDVKPQFMLDRICLFTSLYNFELCTEV